MKGRFQLGSWLLAGAMALSTTAFADTGSARDAQIQGEVTRQLQKKSEFNKVRFSVEDGIVTLNGTVDTYKHKLDAEKRVRKTNHVTEVRDLVQLESKAVSDAQLREQLAKKLRFDGFEYERAFNFLTLNVNQGVVTLGGEVLSPWNRDSVVAEAANTPGVKDIVNKIKVAPASIYDDDLRVRTARAIYRDPALFRYAMDPQAPIRIVVDNGHVGLYGVVDSNMDRTIAGMRARQVFGAFGVDNHLVTSQEIAR
jgi:osmotically-inducible protein OsmY